MSKCYGESTSRIKHRDSVAHERIIGAEPSRTPTAAAAAATRKLWTRRSSGAAVGQPRPAPGRAPHDLKARPAAPIRKGSARRGARARSTYPGPPDAARRAPTHHHPRCATWPGPRPSPRARGSPTSRPFPVFLRGPPGGRGVVRLRPMIVYLLVGTSKHTCKNGQKTCERGLNCTESALVRA